MLMSGAVAYTLVVPPIELISGILPVEVGPNPPDTNFSRAFTVLGGPVDPALTVFTTISYNPVDSTPMDSFPVAYTVGDGTNDWWDLGTGPQPVNAEIVWDWIARENGPVSGTNPYTGGGPWLATPTVEQNPFSLYWYYVQVQVFNVGATSNFTSFAYARETAGA